MTAPQRPTVDQTIVFTYTNDLARASDFFANTLELDFVVDQGRCHIFGLNEKSFIGVCDLRDGPDGEADVTITIVSNDVDGWYEFLTAKGVEYVKEPGPRPQFGIYNSLFVSPHGYRVEIQSFDDPDWLKGRISSR